MARRLVLMGSGETTPTMVEVHKQILADLGPDADAVVVDTPYGFQRNADEITERTLGYFAHNVGASVDAVSLRRVEDLSPARIEDAVDTIEQADWVFAGPGSPTYLQRQWAATRLPEVLRARLDRPGATVFASAAVCSIGRRTLPVYEIYKVGEAPHWRDGFALTDVLGWSCVLIPHFDNAEGGTHDTRFCYLGEERLQVMEALLDQDEWILGIDEHTAAVIDLDAGTLEVAGRGGVTVRDHGRVAILPAGSVVGLDEVERLCTSGGTDGRSAAAPTTQVGADADGPDPEASTPLLEAVAEHVGTADAALADRDPLQVADEILALAATLRAWSADTQQSDEMDRGVAALERLVVRLARMARSGATPRRDLVAPFVTSLLDLRADARQAGDFATADRIRDALGEAGVEVRDTPDGAEWELTDDAQEAG